MSRPRGGFFYVVKKDGEVLYVMAKLTIKQKKFANQYILGGNARRSAIDAGYSKKTASETGYENLNKPHIVEYIDNKLRGHELDVKLRQRQTIDYALGVLHQEETEEHAFVTGNEAGTHIEVVRLKPKIKDRTEAAKFLTTIMSTVEKNRLQNMKLEKEIAKLEKELHTDQSTEDKLDELFDKLESVYTDE